MSPQRTEAQQRQVEQRSDANMAVIANDIGYIKSDVADIKRRIEAEYVTRQEFEPIKKLIYALVGLILTSVVGALLALVVRS